MSPDIHPGSYRAVLALPYALPTFAAALVGRLAYGLLPLSLLFTVHAATGSFATAGAVVAAFGLTSLSMPYKSRFVDRLGQARVLPPLAVSSGGALGAIAALGGSDVDTTYGYVALGIVAGLCAPPLGPSMRSTWRHLTEGTSLKQRAYSLDSVCEESLYLIGPMLVGLLLAIASGAFALTTTAGLLIVGTLGMVRTPPARRRNEAPASAMGFDAGPLRATGFAPVLATILATATALSLVYTCIAARAEEHGTPEVAGFIEAGIAAGSVLGGLLWGRLNHHRSRSTQLFALVGYLGFGMLLASTTAGLLSLGAVMALTGVAIAPLFVVAYLASDELAPPHQRTEASTWVNTANNVGSALGASGAGVLIESADTSIGFAVGGAALTLTAAAIRIVARR
ncbi:MFS transporter [Nocardioidaceae bacterium SCSIO 66511]|nr:MFS transporter [Nocardioidaceae bacterium SCSIO 66511]